MVTGIGSVVIGSVSLVVFLAPTTTAAILGSIIYKLLIAFAFGLTDYKSWLRCAFLNHPRYSQKKADHAKA